MDLKAARESMDPGGWIQNGVEAIMSNGVLQKERKVVNRDSFVVVPMGSNQTNAMAEP